MFRSLLFAVGIFLLILGAQSLVVDKWIMTYSPVVDTNSTTSSVFQQTSFLGNTSSYYNSGGAQNNRPRRVYQTTEWLPWSLLAAGAIIVLYTYTSAGGGGGGEG